MDTRGFHSVAELLEAEREHPLHLDGARPWRFISAIRRDQHVLKHVLESRSERWHQVLDADLLRRVRDSWDPERHPEFPILARAYEAELGRVMDSAMDDGGRYARLVRFEVGPAGPGEGTRLGVLQADFRSLVGWCPEKKIRAVAGIPVRSEGVLVYRLLSGYRHDLRASPGRFDRRIRERLHDRTHHGQERIVQLVAAGA